MGAETKIQWTDHTFNPWIGCTKVSAGCKNCYALMTTRARVLRAQGHETWGRGAQRARTTPEYWKQPLRWNSRPRICDLCGHESPKRIQKCPAGCGCDSWHRPRVFCASTADWLDDEVPIEWLADLLKVIHDTPNLDWQLLTKRPENFKARMVAALEPASWPGRSQFMVNWLGGKPPPNVWIGASAEDQPNFDRRYMQLSAIPARVRFWSLEPLLGSIDFTAVHYISSFKASFHWVIVGGESGPGARICHTDDVSDVVSQCELAEVPCFVKQLGSNAVGAGGHQPYLIAMKHKKGGDMQEWHPELRVRQFPGEVVS
jgi:protein gp37